MPTCESNALSTQNIGPDILSDHSWDFIGHCPMPDCYLQPCNFVGYFAYIIRKTDRHSNVQSILPLYRSFLWCIISADFNDFTWNLGRLGKAAEQVLELDRADLSPDGGRESGLGSYFTLYY